MGDKMIMAMNQQGFIRINEEIEDKKAREIKRGRRLTCIGLQ